MTQGVYSWSKTAASNASADSSINWAEGQSPSSVNDSARAEMARLAEYRDDTAGSLTTGGTSTAYTLTTNQVFDMLAHMSGQSLKVRFNAANGASPTLNVDGLGAKPLQNASGTAITTGQIAANSVWDVTYDNSIPAFLLSGVPAVVPAGTANAASVKFAAGSMLLGSSSSGAGNGSEITLGTGLAMSSTTLSAATPVPAAFKNLAIKVASNTTVTLSADFITVTDGTAFQTLAFSSTINLGTTGANALDTGVIAIDTWYYIWAIAKSDGTTAGLASTSSTAPTMPSGYTFKARVGEVQTIHASATLYGTWQLGRTVQYVVGLAQTANLPIATSGALGSVSVPTWNATSLARFVPPTASRVMGAAGSQSGSATVLLAPNNSYGNSTSTTNPPPIRNVAGNAGSTLSTIQFDFLLESTSIYYASDGGSSFVVVSGWETNI